MTRKPLYFTFANHMHWVDFDWLWGYQALPDTTDDMLRLIDETGAPGCVNYDAIGYEKMAGENPDAFARLRDAVRDGRIEPVGCSYGQPYGLFQGGESNIRQFTFGVRAVARLLGVRPATFWEEEFYFYPQLPQVLRLCGFTGANLFFQWTWHTPEIPKESASLILWEGIDGTRLPALPRNDLNLHQWPEDFDGLLNHGLINELSAPAISQWVELMPSRDWMCRAEVLLPRLQELMTDQRFDVRPRTCTELIRELAELRIDAPVRRYAMDAIWHGVTLGKNADRHPRASRRCERTILEAESLAALAGLFGRPYAQWDVYPAWEVEEAWRELLSAQHHDNHECEGLCGFVGFRSMDRAQSLASEVLGRTAAHFEDRAGAPVVTNGLGWARTVPVRVPGDGPEDEQLMLLPVAPFGYATGAPIKAPASELSRNGPLWTIRRAGRGGRGGLEADVDTRRGVLLQVRSESRPDGALAEGCPVLDLRMLVGGDAWALPEVSEVESTPCGIRMRFPGARDAEKGPWVSVGIGPEAIGVDIAVGGIDHLPRPDPGFVGALRMPMVPVHAVASIRADTPLSVGEVRGGGRVSRKYPEGDWMTSPQWFEHVEGAIFAHSFIDLLGDDARGLLILHNGSQQWFRTARGAEVILNAYDPWDERRYAPGADTVAALRLVPHTGLRDSQRIRLASQFAADDAVRHGRPLVPSTAGRPVGGGGSPQDHPIPGGFGALEVCGAPNVLAHAFYRESAHSGQRMPDWAGHRMAAASNGECTHPYIVRLVEWDGEPADVTLNLPGPVALSAKTNLMGEVAGDDALWLEAEPAETPDWARGAHLDGEPIQWSQIRFRMRPREIATIMADLVMGRKIWRDLDAKRQVWARVHKKS